MAKEYIEREAAVVMADYAEDEHPYDKDPKRPETFSAYHEGWSDACDYIRSRLESLPAADVAPVRHGRWEKAVESQLDTHTGEYWEEYYYNCLECDYASEWKSPYYPNCGAKMDLEG